MATPHFFGYVQSSLVSNLQNLGNLAVQQSTDNQIVVWQEESQKWIGVPASGGGVIPVGLESFSDFKKRSPLARGNALVYDGEQWSNADPHPGATSLAELGDTQLGQPAQGDVITYSGGKWVAAAVPLAEPRALDSLADVDVSGATTGDFLAWSGGYWVPQTPSTTPEPRALDSLEDVGVTDATAGDVLGFKGGRFVPITPYEGLTLRRLEGTEIKGAQSGQVLRFDADKRLWVNRPIEPEPAVFGRDVVDVKVSNARNNEVLALGEDSVWRNTPQETQTLAGLADVTGTASDGDVLTYAGGQWTPSPPAAPPAPPALADLADTDITAPTEGQHVAYNASSGKWENQTPAELALASLADTAIESAQDGQVLAWSGNRWTNQALPSSDPANLADLSDVSLLSPADQDRLVFSDAAWRNAPAPQHKFEQTTDVTLAAPAPGNQLRYSEGRWVNAAAANTSVLPLRAATDVALAGVSANQVLAWNGASWANADRRTPALVGLQDVTSSGATEGQLLTYRGGVWGAESFPEEPPVSLGSLSDTAIDSAQNGQVLRFDATSASWKNAAGTPSVAHTLAGLTDTLTSEAQAGDRLIWTGAGFAASAPPPSATSALSDLTDVAVSGVAEGDEVSWNGAAWGNRPARRVSLASLTDTAGLVTPTEGQVLRYDGTDWRSATVPRVSQVHAGLYRQSNFVATAAPGAAEDLTKNYKPGSLWIDQIQHKVYVCTDPTSGQAQWSPLNTDRLFVAFGESELAGDSADEETLSLGAELRRAGTWTTSNGQGIVIPRDGLYVIDCWASLETNATNNKFTLKLYRNGSEMIRKASQVSYGGYVTNVICNRTILLQANDVITAAVVLSNTASGKKLRRFRITKLH